MASDTIYAASSNPGKLRDFAAAAVAHACAIAPMPCLDRIPPPPEDEATFEGNARVKAVYYSRLAPGLTILADDSGLEVDALDGEPGVRSARFAADHQSAPTGVPDEDNNRLLLEKLAHVPAVNRTARYRCVLALALNGEALLTAQGAVEGLIATHPQGTGGFGYDPLFYLPGLSKTMAEIDLETRNSLSHRGHALKALFAALQKLPG